MPASEKIQPQNIPLIDKKYVKFIQMTYDEYLQKHGLKRNCQH